MMFSRDIEVHSLNIESQRLVHEAESLMRQLKRHQAQLNAFVDDAQATIQPATPAERGQQRRE
jgi:hypothetical protein